MRRLLLNYLDGLNGRLSEDLDRRQQDRRLLVATIRGLPDVDWNDFRTGVEDCFLPWIKSRTGLRGHFGCLIPASSSARWTHAHLILYVERQLRGAGAEWAQGGPPTAKRWAQTGNGALLVQVLRADHELRIPGGPLLDLRNQPDPRFRRVLDCNLGSVRYLVQQMPPVGVPPRKAFTIEGGSWAFRDFRSFEEYRNFALTADLKRPNAADLAWRDLELQAGELPVPLRERMDPVYLRADRRAWGAAVRCLPAYRSSRTCSPPRGS